MRTLFFNLMAGLVALVLIGLAADKPPEKLVFETKMGNVTFEHVKHQERVKGDCKICHEKLFPQSRAPIAYKAGMHKTAEANKTACAACHVAGGTAFVTAGNCSNSKCHVKG
jgi:c(7)-type cytochrome triheme protein